MTGTTAADISSEDIADDIAQAIVAHWLPPGTKLREEALARVYNVSRTKIRAAPLMLVKDKLIRMEPDRGAFVAKSDKTEAREVFVARCVLEVALMREFIAKATPVDYKRSEKHLAEEHKVAASGDLSGVLRRNRLVADFHLPMADVVGSSVLKEMLYELSARNSIITMMYQSTYDAVRSSDEHTVFLEATKRGDVEGAIALMEERMAHTEASLKLESPGGRATDLVAVLLAWPRVPTYTLRVPASAELDIKKSRFIGLAMPVEDRAAAMGVTARLRAEHPATTYVCWALLTGGQSDMSDDGEPSGTAGRPILEVPRHHDLDATLGAVVCYFGGVRLGADGLIRAYTGAIATALMQAERVERIASTTLTLAIGYADEARIRRRIDDHGYALLDAVYDAGVTLTVRLPVTDEVAAQVVLRDLTQGCVVIT